MRMVFYILSVLILSQISVSATVISQDSIYQANEEFHVNGHILHFGWRYAKGDHQTWAEADFDDSDWDVIAGSMGPETFASLDWDGIGWFRYSFEVDDSVQNIPLIMFLAQFGASEIYLDGSLIGAFGRVHPNETFEALYLIDNLVTSIPLPNLTPGRHVIAVRFSNFVALSNVFYRMPVGMRFLITEQAYGIALREKLIRTITFHQMLLVIPLSMSLLHVFLFIFQRNNRENLYYALLALSIAGMICMPMALTFTHDLLPYAAILIAFKLTLALSGIFGLWFIMHFFQGKITPYFRFVVGVGALLILLSFFLPLEVYFVFLLFTYPVAVRTIFQAFCKKRRGAGLVGIGLLVFIGCCVFQIFLELGITDRPIIFFPYIYGSVVLVLTMSFHLARIFAQTQENLERQLQQVKELSALALAQERERKRLDEFAQEEEEKRRLLEADTAQKAKALEESKKRQSILEQLQETNEAIEDAQEKLVQSEKMASLGNLVAGIAHEINTPVGAINSMHDTLMRAMGRLQDMLKRDFGDMMEDRSLRAPLKVIGDANRVISTGAERVTEIVRSLRSFARLDDAERKEADLHEGLENTLTLVHHDLKNRVEIIREYGQLPLVVCFPSRINQVFLNLLVNASQAIEGKGRIVLRTRHVGDRVEIEIEDSGKGIPQENLARIFDPGFTTKGVGVGTGLGLSICYQIVEDHQGDIRVQSEVGRGTTFTIVLPVSGNNI